MPDADEPIEPTDHRAALAKVIARRAGVSWWLGLILALAFAALVTPAVTAEHWLLRFHPGSIAAKHEAPFTVRAPMFAGYDNLKIGGGVVVARGDIASRDEAAIADAIATATPRGPVVYFALFALSFALAAVFSHHMRRSSKGRLARVQVASLAVIAVLAVIVKIVLLSTALSVLVVPVAVLAMVPTMALDRIVGLATGVLAALIISLLAPFDVGLAILLLVQAATAGLVISERLKRRWLAALAAGLAATLCTSATYALLTFLSTGHAPALGDPLHSAWVAAAFGPALAALIAVPLLPPYQVMVGEITQARLFALEDLSHPLLRQIAEKSPGTWQHSLMMANMAEIAANAIGASGRLVRVGAYYHDLGKSLQAKYFIENLEPGETSPHDRLPPEVSCDAIFAHVTEGIVAARKARLHERIVDFMHMHHGSGVLEYFWVKCREHGNPHQLTIEQFRYPGHPPQSRETAILAICDSVEAASRTLHKPDAQAIDSLVQRIVHGKLHLGQLDESGLSMSDLRRISDSLRETIRHANHGRIEYPWQRARQDASATGALDRQPARDPASPDAATAPLAVLTTSDALAVTAEVGRTRGAADRLSASTAPASQLRGAGLDAAAGSARESPASASSNASSSGAKIRAGTARNTHARPSSEAGSARDDFDTQPDLHDARSAAASAERAAAGSAHRASAADPAGAATTRATSASRDDRSAAVEPEPRGPVPHAEAAARDAGRTARGTERGLPLVGHAPAPPRDPMSTAPGRAPGPTSSASSSSIARDTSGESAGPAPSAVSSGAYSAMPPGPPGDAPSSPAPRAMSSGPHAGGPSATAGGVSASATADGTARERAAVLRAEAMTRRPSAPTPPFPRVDQRRAVGSLPPFQVVAEVGRAGESPVAAPREPAAMTDDAIATPPPPLRRGPSGHPALPTDPAQLATALARLSARVSAAPFGVPAGVDELARTGVRIPVFSGLPPGAAGAPALQPRGDVDAAATQPVLAAASRPIQRVDGSPASALAAPQVSPAATQPMVPITASPVAPAATERMAPLATGRLPQPATALIAPITAAPPTATQPMAPINQIDAAQTTPQSTRPGTAPAPAPSTAHQAPFGAQPAATTAHRFMPTARPGSIEFDGEIVQPALTQIIMPASSRAGAPLRSSGLVDDRKHRGPDTRRGHGQIREPGAPRPPAPTAEAGARSLASARITVPHPAPSDAGATEPSLPSVRAADRDADRDDDVLTSARSADALPAASAGWTTGLAERIDAALSDEWGGETPIVAPSSAELRALLGQPDQTRQLPVMEIELLQRRAAELADEPPRRSPHPTAEVDPDDIEAAIEVAPPARRPTHVNAIGARKPAPKKPPRSE